MEKPWIILTVGALLVMLGAASCLAARRIRRIGLLNSGHQRWERYVPFGGHWMETHEKEHLLSIRLSGIVAILMGLAMLYVGLLRLR